MLLFDLGISLSRPLSEYGATNTNFTASQTDGTFKILAHTHAQLQALWVKVELLGHEIPLLLQSDKILILGFGGGGLTTSNGADSHQTKQTETGARLGDLTAQSHGFFTRGAARLGFLTRRVDLNVDTNFGKLGFRREKVGACSI